MERRRFTLISFYQDLVRKHLKSGEKTSTTYVLVQQLAIQPTHVYVVVQVDAWFNFCFLLFQTHYHRLPYPNIKENEI